jgi:hypothetical protein
MYNEPLLNAPASAGTQRMPDLLTCKQNIGGLTLCQKKPLSYSMTRIQASVLIRGKWQGRNSGTFLFCSHIDGTYFAIAIG